MMELFWLLLPVAAATGWMAAKRSFQKEERLTNREQTPAYFKGLNHLLNEQPDKAIDVFVKMLEVDSETVETHLALGNLFRRRGEVERAIRIHQNLIARPTLNRNQRAQALLELGQDYMRAGLFDRAESLFEELVEMGQYEEQATEHLRVIYQQEKDWRACLKVTKRQEQLTHRSLGLERAHYYCECAQDRLNHKDYPKAKHLLKKALLADARCVRATLLQGQMEMAENAPKQALKTLKKAELQEPAFISVVLPLMIECFERLGDRREMASYFRHLSRQTHDVSVALELSRLILEGEGDIAAIDFLTNYLNQHPNLEGLDRLITLNLQADESRGHTEDSLKILQQLVKKILEGRSGYQCGQCGFSAKMIHWQCPGCKSWSSIKPINESNV